MTNPQQVLRERLSGLTASQRALLFRQLAVTDRATGAAGANVVPPMHRELPQRVDADARGWEIAIYPASNGQQRMWFLHHYQPDSPVYCTPRAFDLHGPLDVSRLEAAFCRVIQRHDSLRTTFAMEHGELVQRVGSGTAFQLERWPATAARAEERRAEAERAVQEAACRSFDLTASPPFRVVLATFEPDEHLLLVAMHHIISDGWSLANFCAELAAVYSALNAGTDPSLPDLPVQFADYAARQRRWLGSRAFEEQAAYWKTKLSGAPESLDLPADHPRPAVESLRGGTCALPLEGDLVAAVRELASKREVTLFMVLLAAFKVLLQRYTGQEDLVIGVPIANRRELEVEGLIGFFANTLVLRTAAGGDLSFTELLDRVKETALEAYEHQDMPFELLVNLLQVRRDASRTPLFQASFALQDYPPVRLPLPGLEVKARRVNTQSSKFDLSLKVEAAQQGLHAEMEFSRDLFEPARIQRMLEHWREILRGIVAHPDQRIAEIPLATPAEEQRVLVTWNDTAQAFPLDETLPGLFTRAARRTPEATAVRYAGRAQTYRELDERSDLLARHLRALGVQSETRVAVCMNTSPLMVVALLGILKAGGAYVPLDPCLPPGRLNLILEDVAAPLLVTHRSLEGLCATFTGARVFLDEWRPSATGALPGKMVSSSQAAYVIYTSGSTGRPKGVVIEHRSAVNLLYSMRTLPGIRADDIWLSVTSISFDISVVELFLPLSVGACVVLAPDEVRGDGSALVALLQQSGATILQATPVTWKLLLQAGWTGGQPLKALTGGEALAGDLAVQMLQRCSEVWNLYGPTETTVYSLGGRVEPGAAITIGKPLANTVAYIVDPRGRPTPIGVPGELWIGGAGVAREYLQRPALTTERFIPDPFSRAANARLYRTGDLCRWGADGSVEFLGRLDTQVKLRGYRIELGEIETALRELPGVQEAVVVLRDAPDGEKGLIAYVVPDAGAAVDEAALRAALGFRLPGYMIPAHVECLATLPLTASGKVERGALPAPTRSRGASWANTEPARNLLELNLVEIWQRILQKENVSRDDHFFDLGGHSIMAAQMVAEVEKLVGRRVPISLLFQAPTVAALARLLIEKDWAPPWSSLVPLQPGGSEVPLFCVHGWGGDVYGFVDLARELAPERPVYGLQAVGLAENRPEHVTVEEMAVHYARELRSLRPQGPYYLMGHSLGGWIAFALARELASQGQKVAFLAMLDTYDTADLPARARTRVLTARLRLHLRRLADLPKAQWLPYLGGRARALGRRLRKKKTPQTDPFAAASQRYRPEKYHGDLDLFVVGTSQGWQRTFWEELVVGRVYVHQTSGCHHTLIEKSHVKAFAALLKSLLYRVETEQRPT